MGSSVMLKQSLCGSVGHHGAGLPTYPAHKWRLKKTQYELSGDFMKSLHEISCLNRMEKGNIPEKFHYLHG